MNFLGHLFLSGHDDLVTVGNFMADAVKGRDLSRFPQGLEKGIRLHRAIDTFTDTHPIQQQGRERAHAYAGRYASVVMDLFYDHILAAHWGEFHPEPLPVFAQRMYRLLERNLEAMPERTQHMVPYMIAGDWLSSYATLEGIGRALDGLSRRVPEGAAMRGAEAVLKEHLITYTGEFRQFLPAIVEHTSSYR
jgi:acyl carrier protein phosphodiesterase